MTSKNPNLKVATMTKQTRWVWALGVAMLCAGAAKAQDKKVHEKHDASALYYTLRDVINAGAKIFNDNGDHAGCYRMYQGSLMSVKPFLAPELQKSIDAGLANAEKLHSYADRSFELRKVLDEIRAKTKPAGLVETKDGKDDGKGEVAGRVTYEGKPLAGGYFITLVSAESKKFSSALQKDGTFSFKTPIPAGEYRVVIEPIPGETAKSALPKRYASEATSGLAIRIQSGKQQIQLNLVN